MTMTIAVYVHLASQVMGDEMEPTNTKTNSLFFASPLSLSLSLMYNVSLTHSWLYVYK